MDLSTTTLVCPRNDEEALTILKLAKAIGLATVVSRQPHGAKLFKEKRLIGHIMEANENTQTVAIVEIPGPETEVMLRGQGLEVLIIDHHRYDEVDRRNAKSSLEQFRDLFGIDDEKAKALGFDPWLLASVAAIDRGFVWELRKMNYTQEEIRRALDHYRTLTLELGEERRLREEQAAEVAWERREERDGLIIVRSAENDISVRDPLSFILAKNFDGPREVLIVQGKRRMYVQDTSHATELFDAFGGFTFGGARCWGILKSDEILPPEEEVIAILLKK
jgi:hypothetical protein